MKHCQILQVPWKYTTGSCWCDYEYIMINNIQIYDTFSVTRKAVEASYNFITSICESSVVPKKVYSHPLNYTHSSFPMSSTKTYWESLIFTGIIEATRSW